MLITTLHLIGSEELRRFGRQEHNTKVSVPYSTAGLKLSFPDSSRAFYGILLQGSCTFYPQGFLLLEPFTGHATCFYFTLVIICYSSFGTIIFHNLYNKTNNYICTKFGSCGSIYIITFKEHDFSGHTCTLHAVDLESPYAKSIKFRPKLDTT